MMLGIVGSRKRASPEDKQSVQDCISEYRDKYSDLRIISGGCPVGADNFAEEAAKYFGIPVLIMYPVRIPEPKSYSETVERMYRRNRLIAREATIVMGWVSLDRKGGTEYTLKHAVSFEKETYAVLPDFSRDRMF